MAGPVLSLLLPVALGTICLSYSAYAEIGSSDVDFSLSVDATPSLEIVLAGDGLTTSPTSLGLNIKPNIDGTPVFKYSDLDVTVATSNATGYYLTLSTTRADGALVTSSSNLLSTLSGTSSSYICTEATAASCGFTTNRWGYKLAQDDVTAYQAAPGSAGTKIDEIYTTTNGEEVNMRIGAKVDSSIAAGDYSTTMSFIATAHPTTYAIYFSDGAANETASSMPPAQSDALNNSDTTTITISSVTPTWTGHTFNKWCLGTITSTEYANDTCTGTEYSPGDTITFSMDDVVSVTLKAMWNINSYSIKYGTTTGIASVTLDGQTCTEAVSGTGCSKTLIYGKPYNISATASTGYSFSSYSATAGSFGSASTASTTYTPAAGAATITPNASANTYSITIKTSAGISSVSLSGGNLTSACSTTSTSGTSCTLTYGQTYTLEATVSTGYTFSSWSNSAPQGTIAGTTTASTTYTPGTAATTLTPSATANSYSITLNGDSGVSNFTVNGSTISKGGSVSLTYGQTYTITINYANGYEAAATPLQKSSGSGSVSGTSFTVGAGTATLYANSKSSKIYMQTMSFSQCTSAGVTVYDSRNESVAYTVKLISLNGKNTCWMMSNLKLPGGTTLATSDSNVSSSYTLPSDTGSSGWADDYCQPYMASKNGEYYYNWPAATARTNSTSSTSDGCFNDTGNSKGDICPKGWRLPVYSGEVDNSTWRSNLQANGSLTKTGYFYSSYQLRFGSAGYWWTSTRNNDLDAAVLFSDGSAAYGGNDSKYIGCSVRCMRTI